MRIGKKYWRPVCTSSAKRRRVRIISTGPLASYRESLGIEKTLIAKDPNNSDWQRDVQV